MTGKPVLTTKNSVGHIKINYLSVPNKEEVILLHFQLRFCNLTTVQEMIIQSLQ